MRSALNAISFALLALAIAADASAQCTYQVSPTPIKVGPIGGDVIVTVDTAAGCPVVKLDNCEDGFSLVPAQTVLRTRIDGVKPPTWLKQDGSTDWFKVSNFLSVRILADGSPQRYPTSLATLAIMALYPECDFDSTCRTQSESDYRSLGWRKLEPEWHQLHWDWEYVDMPLTQRVIECRKR